MEVYTHHIDTNRQRTLVSVGTLWLLGPLLQGMRLRVVPLVDFAGILLGQGSRAWSIWRVSWNDGQHVHPWNGRSNDIGVAQDTSCENAESDKGGDLHRRSNGVR